MKTVVISAINIYSSGPLVIVRDFLSALVRGEAFLRGDMKIILFCHSTEHYTDFSSENILFIPKPLSRKNWFIRLFYEYFWFWWWSIFNKPDYWISLHDLTPNVRAEHRIVYCHQAAPFYNGKQTWRYAPGFEMFRRFYKYFYRLNLWKNDYIVVQQQWLRDAFVEQFGCKPGKIIVARPEVDQVQTPTTALEKSEPSVASLVFVSFPRVFKNHEILLKAMRSLSAAPIKLFLTFAGTENAYAQKLAKEASVLKNVELTTFLSREKLFQLYASVDAMVFPSKLETWGLPLSEFRRFNKPIFAADLPYAKETLSGYEQACYFNPDNPAELAGLLEKFAVNHEFIPVRSDTVYAPPFTQSWDELINFIGLA